MTYKIFFEDTRMPKGIFGHQNDIFQEFNLGQRRDLGVVGVTKVGCQILSCTQINSARIDPLWFGGFSFPMRIV